MAGAGAKRGIDDLPRLAKTYGGNATDWVKKASTAFTAKDGKTFETHWYERISNATKYEQKTKLTN